jgi:hypothetical protein
MNNFHYKHLIDKLKILVIYQILNLDLHFISITNKFKIINKMIILIQYVKFYIEKYLKKIFIIYFYGIVEK